MLQKNVMNNCLALIVAIVISLCHVSKQTDFCDSLNEIDKMFSLGRFLLFCTETNWFHLDTKTGDKSIAKISKYSPGKLFFSFVCFIELFFLNFFSEI